MNNLKDTLLNRIKTGEVNMVPHWKFVLHATLLGVALVIVGLIATYLLSFVLFVLHQNGVLFAPLFGWNGFMLLVVSSPWIIIGLVGVFLALLYLLVSRYSFSYRKPLVYSMIGVVLAVIAISSLIQQMAIHERMGAFIEQHEVPGLAPLYRDAARQHPDGVRTGEVVSLTDDALELQAEDGSESTIVLTERTKLPRRGLSVGDAVMVFGMDQNGSFEAFGVRFADDARPMLPPPNGERPFENASSTISRPLE